LCRGESFPRHDVPSGNAGQVEINRLGHQAEGGASPLPGDNRRPVLILGLGNPLYGDDGVGPAVVQLLKERELPPEVEVLDGGTAGLGLLDTIAGRRRLLVVDAAEMGRPAGTVLRLSPEEARLVQEQAPLSPHQVGLAEVFDLAARLEMAPAEVLIFAVQPEYLGWRQELSPSVQQSLPGLVSVILAEVGIPSKRSDGSVTQQGGRTMAKKILVVDDDPDTVEVIRMTLESANYEVVSASNGEEGLRRVVADKPDLIILDVMMDTTTAGFQFSLTLRSPDEDSPYAAYRSIPILMLTAIHTTTPLRFGPDSDYLPVNEFVEKPIAPEALLQKVAKLLAK
jgi:hydrogenase maturation protease